MSIKDGDWEGKFMAEAIAIILALSGVIWIIVEIDIRKQRNRKK